SSGAQIFKIGSDGLPAPLLTAAGAITAIACSPSGLIAAACEAHGILTFDCEGKKIAAKGSDAASLSCVTALAFADEDTLLVCVGSADNPLAAWQRDLLEQRHSGALWRIDLKKGSATRIASGLAFPNGVLASNDGS